MTDKKQRRAAGRWYAFVTSALNVIGVLLLSVWLPPQAYAWKMEAGSLTLSATSSATQLQSHTFAQIYDTPPVVIILTDDAGGDPSAVRINNVSKTGFQASQVEPNSEDGPHAAMTVSYFAIEPGVHTLDDGTVLEAGIVNTQEQEFNGKEADKSAKAGTVKHKLANTFTKPILLTHLQTTNNEPGIQPKKPSHPWMTVAVEHVKDDEIEVAIDRAEVYDAKSGKDFIFNALAKTESIGYVAINSAKAGSFNDFGGLPVFFETQFVKSVVDGWDEGCDAINFTGKYTSTPLVFASLSSRIEKDGGWLRECDRDTTRIRLTIDEDQKQDAERKHKKEDVSVLVFSKKFIFDSNTTPAPTSDYFMLEADSVSLSPSQFTSVSFRQGYEQPPAVFVLGDNGNPEPTTVRIRNVTKTGFEVVPTELQIKSGYTDAVDQNTVIHYLAVPYGQFQFPDGKKIEVSSFPISNYQAKHVSGSSWLPFSFKSGFSGTPALLGQIQTMSNEPGHVPGAASVPSLETAFSSVTNAGANLALERAETDSGTLTQPETVAYLAVETGVINNFFDIDGNVVKAEAVRTPDNIAGSVSCYTANFAQTYTGEPLLVGSQNTRDGGDGGWLRRCATASKSATLKIEEDWARDKDNSHTTEIASFMVFSQPFAADFSQVANYRLEEKTWAQVPGEVKDFGNLGLHGKAVGTAIPKTAKVCAGASLDGKGYVEVADNDNLDILDELTVMAWFNASQLPKSGLMTIVSKDENFEFHLQPNGSIYWWWTGSGGTRSFDTGGFRVATGDWHHVAVVYSKKNSQQKIYVDGVERAAKTYANETLVKNTDPLYIGTDLNFPSRNFKGLIDEVRIFTRALGVTAVNQYKDITRPCDSCTLGSFEIAQDDYGLACPSTRSLVSLKALCDDGITVKDDYTGTINLSASPADGNSVTDFYLQASGGAKVSTYTFDGTEKGLLDLYLYHNNENDVLVNVEDSLASVTSLSTDPTGYRTTGLVVTTPGNLSCGTTGKVVIQAIGQNPGNTGCGVLEGFSGDKSLKAWFTAATDPGSGADDPVAAPLQLEDSSGGFTPLSVQTKPGADNLTLKFVDGKAEPQVKYENGTDLYVGKIKSLSFEYATAPSDGVTLPIINSSGSTPFVFYPVGSRTLVTEANSDCSPAGAGCSAFKQAGDSFIQKVEFVCSDLDNSNLSDNAMPNQFRTGADVALGFQALAGTSCDDSSTRHNGDCITADATAMTSASKDVIQSYAEVGVVKLEVADYDYFGITVPKSDVTVGRFYPAYFTTSVVEDGALSNGCGSFTYTGQQVGVNGAIGYATRPKVRFTPFNKNNKETDGYQGAFNKLTTAGISLTEPTADASQNGRDGVTKMLVSSGMTVGTLTKDVVVGIVGSISEYELAATDHFLFEKNSNALVGPFTSDLNFTLTSVTDGEASANDLPRDMEPTGVELRYGRWNMESQSGPETMGLSLLSQAEYWTGSTFSLNTSDNCTDLSSAISILEDDGDLVAIPVSSGTSDFSYSGPLSGGMGSFTFTPPTGTNNTGSLTVKVDLSGIPWLQYDWYSPDDGIYNPVNHPDVKATFGIYRGHDRIIYWREVNP